MKGEGRQFGWLVVMAAELRRLWLGWRVPSLLLAFSLFLSGFVFLLAVNPEINVLSQLTMISQTIQLSVVGGIVVVLLLGADTFSGERDHRTIESLLLTPVPRQELVIGKLLAVLSPWLGLMLIAIPYVALVAKGTDVMAASIILLIIPGTLLVGLSAGIAVLISVMSPTNLVSFAVALVVMLLLAAPLQLPASVSGLPSVHWLIVSDPITAVAGYQAAVIEGEPWTDGVSRLLSPFIALVLVAGLGPRLLGNRLSLQGGIGQ